MRVFTSLTLMALLIQIPNVTAESPSDNSPKSPIIEIGDGLSLETVPAEFVTTWEEDTRPPPQPEWIIIPATYENIPETVTVQAAYTDIDIVPPVYNPDGSMQSPVRAALKEVPAVTREITRRVVKTPSRVEKRVIPDMYHPPLVRKRIKAKSYIIRDQSGAELHRYDNAEELAHFQNTR